MPLANKLSPPARGALRATLPGSRATRQGRHLGLRNGAMTQATTPPLAVALDAAGLQGDPAKPLPPIPALVTCCWLGSGGTRRLAYINARQTTAGAPRLPLCGDRPVVMGDLAFRRMCAWPSRVQPRTETYGLVRRGWAHDSAAPDFAVTSLAWRTWTGTPSASPPLTVGANSDQGRGQAARRFSAEVTRGEPVGPCS